MTRRVFTVPAEAYGVRVEVRVEYAHIDSTAQELARALTIATQAAQHRHRQDTR